MCRWRWTQDRLQASRRAGLETEVERRRRRPGGGSSWRCGAHRGAPLTAGKPTASSRSSPAARGGMLQPRFVLAARRGCNKQVQAVS